MSNTKNSAIKNITVALLCVALAISAGCAIKRHEDKKAAASLLNLKSAETYDEVYNKINSLKLKTNILYGSKNGMAKGSSPQRNKFLGAYIFTAAAYIFVGTIFELFGFQAVTALGRSVSLPAPLADINGAITLGCVSYLVILGGGLISNGVKGVGKTLKDFSLPVSMIPQKVRYASAAWM